MKEYNIAEYTMDGDRNSYDFFEFEQVILTNALSFDKIVGLFLQPMDSARGGRGYGALTMNWTEVGSLSR